MTSKKSSKLKSIVKTRRCNFRNFLWRIQDFENWCRYLRNLKTLPHKDCDYRNFTHHYNSCGLNWRLWDEVRVKWAKKAEDNEQESSCRDHEITLRVTDERKQNRRTSEHNNFRAEKRERGGGREGWRWREMDTCTATSRKKLTKRKNNVVVVATRMPAPADKAPLASRFAPTACLVSQIQVVGTAWLQQVTERKRSEYEENDEEEMRKEWGNDRGMTQERIERVDLYKFTCSLFYNNRKRFWFFFNWRINCISISMSSDEITRFVIHSFYSDRSILWRAVERQIV